MNDAEFARRALIAAAISIAIAVAIVVSWLTAKALLLVFAGILLAIVLRGLTNSVTKYTHLPDHISLLLVIILILAVISVVIWALIPRVSTQINELSEQLPRSFNQALANMQQSTTGQWLLQRLPKEQDIARNIGGVLREAKTFLTVASDILVSFIIVAFTALYLAFSPGMYVNGIVRLVAIPKRKRVHDVMDMVGYMLLWWLIGRFIDMVIVGVLTGIGLWLIGIPLGLTLGIIAGLLTFVPNFGPIISALPALVLAIPAGVSKVLYVVLLYVVIHAIEGYLISPIVHQKTALVPAVLTIIFQIGMGMLFGVLGLTMATPIVAAGLVLIKALYIEDVLGDRIDVIQ